MLVIFLVPEVKGRAERCQSEKQGEKIIYKNKDKENKTVYQQRSENRTHFCRSDFEEQNFYLYYRILEDKLS